MTVLADQSLYDWLLIFHLLFAMLWVGGGALLALMGVRALRDPDRDAVGRFAASLRVLGPVVLAPSVFGVLAFGLWLVFESPAWDFGQRWIQIGLGLFAVALVIGAAFQSRAALATARAAASADDQEARRQLRRWLWGYALILLLLLIAVWDMTTKPGL